jgi:hypothetical protein
VYRGGIFWEEECTCGLRALCDLPYLGVSPAVVILANSFCVMS